MTRVTAVSSSSSPSPLVRVEHTFLVPRSGVPEHRIHTCDSQLRDFEHFGRDVLASKTVPD